MIQPFIIKNVNAINTLFLCPTSTVITRKLIFSSIKQALRWIKDSIHSCFGTHYFNLNVDYRKIHETLMWSCQRWQQTLFQSGNEKYPQLAFGFLWIKNETKWIYGHVAQSNTLIWNLLTRFLKETTSFLLRSAESKGRDLCASQEAQEALEIRKAAFHNKENETAIDRNGDIRSLFPWTACKRLFKFTSEAVCNRERFSKQTRMNS